MFGVAIDAWQRWSIVPSLHDVAIAWLKQRRRCHSCSNKTEDLAEERGPWNVKLRQNAGAIHVYFGVGFPHAAKVEVRQANAAFSERSIEQTR